MLGLYKVSTRTTVFQYFRCQRYRFPIPVTLSPTLKCIFGGSTGAFQRNPLYLAAGQTCFYCLPCVIKLCHVPPLDLKYLARLQVNFGTWPRRDLLRVTYKLIRVLSLCQHTVIAHTNCTDYQPRKRLLKLLQQYNIPFAEI